MISGRENVRVSATLYLKVASHLVTYVYYSVELSTQARHVIKQTSKQARCYQCLVSWSIPFIFTTLLIEGGRGSAHREKQCTLRRGAVGSSRMHQAVFVVFVASKGHVTVA